MLSEWWTYRPHDFLMFAPRTYWRLFELHNTQWWALPLLMFTLGMALLWVMWRASALPAAARWQVLPGALRWGRALGLVALAAIWVFVALGFIQTHYVPINWAAQSLVWLALAVAALLLVVAAGTLLTEAQRDAQADSALPELLSAEQGAQHNEGARRFCAALGAVALLWPLAAPLGGRPWAQAEWFGMAPDPTALATLALLGLLGLTPTRGALLWARPLAQTLAAALLAASGAVLLTMDELQGAAVWTLLAGWLAAAGLQAWRTRLLSAIVRFGRK